jgi:thiol-disulfide isomerase/thioredoxin
MLRLISYSIVILCISFTSCETASQGYSIKLEIKNSKENEQIILRRYVGATLSIIDSAKINGKSKAIFAGMNPLEPGMYSIHLHGNADIGFFISESQPPHFSISVDLKNPGKSLEFKGSPENQAFAGYLRWMTEKRRMPYTEKLQAEINQKWDELENNFNGTTLALFIRTQRDPQIPEPNIPVILPNREQLLQDYYHKQMANRFFDNFNFSDKLLVTIPVTWEKMSLFFKQVVPPVKDTVIFRVSQLIEKARANDEVYTHTVKHLYTLFRESPLPFTAEVYNHIGEHYIINQPERWKDIAFVERVRDRVSKGKLNPGGFPATNLNLVAPDGRKQDLYSVKAEYTVLLFYDPGCDACQPITEALQKLSLRYREQGLKVFAVYMGQNRDEWKTYIQAHQLSWVNVYDPESPITIEQQYDIHAIPIIYLLDKDKNTVAKDITVEWLEGYLENI